MKPLDVCAQPQPPLPWPTSLGRKEMAFRRPALAAPSGRHTRFRVIGERETQDVLARLGLGGEVKRGGSESHREEASSTAVSRRPRRAAAPAWHRPHLPQIEQPPPPSWPAIDAGRNPEAGLQRKGEPVYLARRAPGAAIARSDRDVVRGRGLPAQPRRAGQPRSQPGASKPLPHPLRRARSSLAVPRKSAQPFFAGPTNCQPALTQALARHLPRLPKPRR